MRKNANDRNRFSERSMPKDQRPKTKARPACTSCPNRPICPIRSKRSSCSRCSRCFRCSQCSRCSRCFRERAMPERKTKHAQLQKARASARAYLRFRISDCGTFYHPVRRSGGHPSYSRRGAFGMRNTRWPAKAGTQNLGAFHAFHLVSVFHRVSVFHSVSAFHLVSETYASFKK